MSCSGDGTIRKNMGIWKSWQPMDGNGLHGYVRRIYTASLLTMSTVLETMYNNYKSQLSVSAVNINLDIRSNPTSVSPFSRSDPLLSASLSTLSKY